MAIVITTCTNRKRKPIPDSLHASSLPKAELPYLAAGWAKRIAHAESRFPAGQIYGGRGFQEAVAAAETLDAQLFIVSAGLGLIEASTAVPPYACTVLVDVPDSIAARTIGDFSVSTWWSHLSKVSPFSIPLVEAADNVSGLICAALSESYIDMISAELLSLPAAKKEMLRIFTRAPLARIAPVLQPFVMPYDDRLDGPNSVIRGTRSDFAGRALRHFAQNILQADDRRSAEAHAGAVQAALSAWNMSERVERVRHDDNALLTLIRAHWDQESGSSSRLLRLFRDDLKIACEQGRFAGLARIVRAERS